MSSPTRCGWLIGSLEVPDFGWNVGAAGDLKDFFQRIVDGVGFAALMRDVDAAVLMSDFGQLDNLISLRKARRHILKRGRNSESAIFHCLGDQHFHLLKFGRRWWSIVVSDDVFAQLRRAHESSTV